MIDHTKIHSNLKDTMERISQLNWVGINQAPINLDNDRRFLMHPSVPQNILSLQSYDSVTFLKVAVSNYHAETYNPCILANEIYNAKYTLFKSRWIVPGSMDDDVHVHSWAKSGTKINKKYKSIYVEGRAFLSVPYEQAYWHLVVEEIGFFLQLKQIVPDIKFVMCRTEASKILFKNRIWIKEFYEIVKEAYPDSFIEIDLEENNNIIVEKSYSMNNFDLDSSIKTQYNVFNLLKDFFNINFKSESIDKKIFLYAKNKTNSMQSFVQENAKIIEKYISNGIIDSEGKVLIGFENYDSQEAKSVYQVADVLARLLDYEEEEKLVNYIKFKGYEIIDPGNMSARDQINLFKQCSNILVQNGAMTLASTMCSDSTKFVIISLNTNYEFPHGDYARSIKNLSVHEVYDRINHPNKKFTADEVISELERQSLL